jgi:hypothetical protein
VLVYGDHSELIDPAKRLDALSVRLAEVARLPPGVDRHGKLVGALVEAGQVLQGVADAGFPAEALDRFVYRLAESVVRSADSRFADLGELPAAPHLHGLAKIEVRIPEGFAFYAVYPESYIEAARRLRLTAPPRVIGIRSIGTTLGAVVAATLGASPPITVRPYGDPFARRVRLPPQTFEGDAHYVIVDEGPGLSGSSFGCIADELERHGVPLDRIAFLPSHGGDLGRRASKAHRARWAIAQRVAAEFDTAWLSGLLGPLEDITGSDPFERRKFLARKPDGRVLVKFSGLGAIGEGKLAMARALHAGGFTPEPLGFVHGFLVERWHHEADRLKRDEKPVEAICRYLGARARLFPARDSAGASIDDLLVMCRRNISLTFGEAACRALSSFDPARLEPRVRRVRTDNKLDRHEWLRLPDGRLLKADAVDHHRAHDLVGCQDLCWDIAGAIVEFDLSADEESRLAASMHCDVDRELLDFCLIAYASFRLGRALISSPAAGAAADRYRNALRRLLASGRGEIRRESLVG